ncbi:MAG: hypothetical protein U5Q44_08220 [Dehalococcoidia bacterium]|nr:hypothetical protein [Dehalococcoidia bacterium]
MDGSPTLPPEFERFIAPGDRPMAAEALAFVQEMLAGAFDAETVAAWCYDYASAGIGYELWPEMAPAQAERGGSLTPAERDALAMSLMDYGENETVSRFQGGPRWS